MRKYKLLKRYPSLPEEWKVGDIVIPYEGSKDFYHVPDIMALVHIREVENYPEFWQEIKEKKYEINSYMYKDIELYTKKTTDFDIQNLEGFRIHSIKRLSDGEIFTEKDEITTSASDSYCFIYGFKIFDSELKIDCTHSFLAHEDGIDLLEDIQHIKKYKCPSKDDEKASSKNFEILEFIGKKTKDITDTHVRLWSELKGDWWGESDLLEYAINTYGIKSIKRLSDDKILSIGDEVRRGKNKHTARITKFTITSDGNMVASLTDVDDYDRGEYCNISALTSIEKTFVHNRGWGRDI